MSVLQMQDEFETESRILDAIKYDNVYELEELLKLITSDLDADFDPDIILCKALIATANQGRTTALRCLLQYGADRLVDNTNEYGNTPLVMAAIRSHGEIMSLLIDAGCCVNKTDEECRLALHWTAMNGDHKLSEQLLRSGSQADVPDKIYGFTPLMQAARQGHTSIVRLLLQYNCEVNRTDSHQETPIFDAVRSNNVECMKLLIGAGANLDWLNKNGRAPIHTAVVYNRIGALKLLIQHNCQLDLHGAMTLTKMGERYTALEQGIMESLAVPCKLLVMAGASVRNLHRFLNMRTDATFVNGQPVSEWIKEALEGLPRTLKDSARIAIRAFYGQSLLNILDSLPIPGQLKLYLTLQEVQDFEVDEIDMVPNYAGRHW